MSVFDPDNVKDEVVFKYDNSGDALLSVIINADFAKTLIISLVSWLKENRKLDDIFYYSAKGNFVKPNK